MKTETQTIRFRFIATPESDRVRRTGFDVTLPATSPMTDFVDAAEERLFAKYPDAEILDTL